MKKIISLALATSMLASMAVTAFATPSDPTKEPHVDSTSKFYMLTNDASGYGDKKAFVPVAIATADGNFGSTFAFEVKGALSKEAMSKYKAFASWTVGADKVDGAPVLQSRKYQVSPEKFDKWNLLVTKVTDTLPTGAGAATDKWLIKNNAFGIFDGKTEAELTAHIAKVVDALTFAKGGAAVDGQIVIADSTGSADGTEISDVAKQKLVKDAIKASVLADTQAAGNTKTETAADPVFDYGYFVVFSTKYDFDWERDKDIRGSLTIAKTSTGAKDNFKLETAKRDAVVVNLTNFKPIKEDPNDFFFAAEELEDLEFGNGTIFTVDTVGMYDIYKWANNNFIDEVVAKYPNAELAFYDWDKHTKFNRTGTLAFFTTNKTAKVYEILEDGTLKLLESKYDEAQEAVTIRTRVLGKYVISDVELVLDAPVVDAPVVDAPVDDVKPNPETGR